MRICYLTCLNERPQVSRLTIECFKRLRDPQDVRMYAAYSNDEDKKVLEDANDPHIHGFNIPNVPVSHKWNSILQYALADVHEFTHFLIMGDDDSLSTEGFERLCYYSYHHHIGFSNNYFYELRTGKAMVGMYQMKNNLIGAGRMFTRKALMETCNDAVCKCRMDLTFHGINFYKGQEYHFAPRIAQHLVNLGFMEVKEHVFTGLWPSAPHQSASGLDRFSELKLTLAGYPPLAIDDDRVHMTDFKSDKNIWPYSILEKKCTVPKDVDATWFLNDAERQIVKSFRK